ncbi:hypothetical protein ACFL3F_04025 [Planctomycetota bacterium]
MYKANILNVTLEHAGRKPEFVYKPIEKADRWSLIEMAAHYYDFKVSEGCSDLFLACIKRYLQRFLDWLGTQQFDVEGQGSEDLTSILLSDYRQSLADDTSIGIKTANHCIDHVRMLLLWGVQMHGISHAPIGSIRQFSRMRNAKEGHGRKQHRDPLSWKDLEKLLSVADIVDTALIMLGLNCGFGNSDIDTLKLKDVDLENGTISHPRPKTGVERDLHELRFLNVARHGN